MSKSSSATFGISGFNKLASRTTVGRYGRGEAIFSQGEAAVAIYRVDDGIVKLSVRSKRGKRATIAMFGQGECFGVDCLRGTSLWPATAISIGGSRIARVEKAQMLRRLRKEPALARQLIKHLLLRVARTQDDHADQLLNSSEQRLARLLLLLSDFAQGPGQVVSLVGLDQGTLAEMVGTTRSRVSHFMNQFRARGFIEYNGNLKVHKALLSFLEDSHTN